MKKGFIALAVATVLAALAPGWQAEAEPDVEARGEGGLSPQARQVVDYLLEDWKKQFRSTSIPLAMSNVGLESNDSLRLEIGQYFRDHTDLANNLKWWGTNNYILSNEEKLIAKYVLNTHRDEERLPGVSEVAQALDLPADRLRQRLGFMAQAGLLVESTEEALGYALADGYKGWGGPLRYNFHTVSIEGEETFDVW